MTLADPQKKSDLCEYFIFCTDIQGQTDILKEFSVEWYNVSPEANVSPPELTEKIKKTIGTVIPIAEFFEDFISGLSVSQNDCVEKDVYELAGLICNRPPQDVLPSYDNLKILKNSFLKPTLKFEQFSDTFLLFCRSSTPECFYNPIGLWYILLQACAVQIATLAAKISMRGAICFGPAMEIGKKSEHLYGPVLVEAKEIENKHQGQPSGYPRIFFSERVLKFIEEELWLEQVKADKDLSRCLSEVNLKDFIYKDDNDDYMLDFLGEAFRRALMTISGDLLDTVTGLIPNAYAFVESEIEKHKNPSRLHSRYSFLLEYMNSRIGVWKRK